MAEPVIHFEIIGTEPEKLREYYGELFGWEFGVGNPSSEKVSERGRYGFVDGATTGDDTTAGINGGIGGGRRHRPRVLFYVAVPDVEAALRKAAGLGGRRLFGPEPAGAGEGELVVGRFTDPEGNEIGVAGKA